MIFGYHCDMKESYIHFFSQKIVLLLFLSAFFLSFLLNIPSFGEKAQFLIGKLFLNRYLLGPLKGLLPFTLFLLTFCLLAYVDKQCLHLRIIEYNSTVETINFSLDQITL